MTKPVEATAHTKFFLRGLITNLLNPKAGVFYLSIFPSFIDEARPLLLQIAILLTAYVTIATASTAVVVSANAIQPGIEKRANTMLIRRIMSALPAVVAIWLFYTTTDLLLNALLRHCRPHGAYRVSAVAFALRTIAFAARATRFANRYSSSSCQFVGSTAPR